MKKPHCCLAMGLFWLFY